MPFTLSHLKDPWQGMALLIVLWCSQWPAFPVQAAEEALQAGRLEAQSLVPAREIHQKNRPVLAWKKSWDQARMAVRRGDFAAAVRQYEILLNEKPSLEEARWELARVLIRQGEAGRATSLLERLLEADPDRLEYLSSLGRLLQEKAYFSRSIELFERALKIRPEDAGSLAGIVQSLVKVRRKAEAYPYLEKLHRLQPDNREVLRELAQMAFEAEDFEKARVYLDDLAKRPDCDLPLLEMAAVAHERLGLENLALAYWERILTIDSGHRLSHDRLAELHVKKGQTEEALFHLQALLEKNPSNSSLLYAIGRLHEDAGHFAEALPYFERYLALRPNDRDVLDVMVNLHEALGEKAKTLASLERLFAIEADPDPAKVELAARLYSEAGRPAMAIPLYRRLLAIRPDDRGVIAALARALAATGEENSALSLWRHLAELEPDRIEVYRAMAEILASQHRNRELLAVVERIHELDPLDERVTLQLAAFYLEEGELERGEAYLEQVDPSTPLQAEYLEIQGVLAEKSDQPARALHAYEKMLEKSPERRDLKLRCIRLAGELGKLQSVRFHLAALPAADDGDARKIIAEAFMRCGLFQEANDLFESLIRDSRVPAEERLEVRLAMAELYRRAGLLFEAEGSLRAALLQGKATPAALERLFELALATGAVEEAEVWWSQLAEMEDRWQSELNRARLLAAKGEYQAAVQLAGSLPDTSGAPDRSRDQHLGLTMARLFLTAGRETAARRQCETLVPEGSQAELERLVLLVRALRASGEWSEAKRAFQLAIHKAKDDVGLLLLLADRCEEAELSEEAGAAAAQALAMAPDSLRARFMLIKALWKEGEITEALAAVQELTAEYPEHSPAQAMEARLLIRAGRYQEAAAKCKAAGADHPYSYELQLIEARALWEMGQREKAVAVYQASLSPSVEQLFEEEGAARGVYYLPVDAKTTLWQLLSYKSVKPSGFIDRVMAPAHAADDSSQRQRDLNSIATPLYARYRWQERFATELAARKAIINREYFQAIKIVESILRRYPEEEELWFDLAALYSNIGDLGEEAAIYQRVAALNQDFPGLAEAAERNRLKRQPRFSLGYDHLREEGREGYKAIQKDQGRLGFWYSPAIQQEVDLTAYRIRYESTEDERSLAANRALVSYRADFFNSLSVQLGGGVEAAGSDSADTGLIDCRVSGRIGDKWRSYFSFVRDVTTDTLASLTRNIVRQDVRTGLGIDVLPQLLIGGDYRHTEFSDDNESMGYELWTSYIVLTEPTLLQIGYTYDFRDSREGNGPGLPLADGFAAEDHPYWAPVNYWVNRFSVSFKHLLAKETSGRGLPRHYILEYSLGHDSEGEAIQVLKGGLFFEWTPRLQVEATAEIASSEPYRASEASISAIYRW